ASLVALVGGVVLDQPHGEHVEAAQCGNEPGDQGDKAHGLSSGGSCHNKARGSGRGDLPSPRNKRIGLRLPLPRRPPATDSALRRPRIPPHVPGAAMPGSSRAAAASRGQADRATAGAHLVTLLTWRYCPECLPPSATP